MTDPTTSTRADYPLVHPIRTRWPDYDMLQHVNNVICHRYFEVVVLHALDEAGLDWLASPVIPYAAETLCRFRRPISPAPFIDAGYRVGRLGTTAVTYELALFAPEDTTPAAHGHFVHVFVERASERPVAIPEPLREYFVAHLAPGIQQEIEI